MNIMNTYLQSLQNKVFKLLPMREAYDNGEQNHLVEYLDNLYATCVGSTTCYPKLAEIKEVVEVDCNIAFLRDNLDSLDFKKWRSMVLRSTRLLHTTIDKYYNEEV